MKDLSYLDDIERVFFSIPERSGSGVEYEGILRIVDNGLQMEYTPKSTSHKKGKDHRAWKKWANQYLGFEFDLEEESPIKVIDLSFANLSFLVRRNYFFFSSILIATDSLHTFTSIPSGKQGRITVYLGMPQRDASARFVSNFNMKLADWRLNHSSEKMEDFRKFGA